MNRRRVLGPKFFHRPALVIARELLGQYLVRRRGRRMERYLITETEAYDGWADKASHAARGRTPRNAPMWGRPGRWYVYFVYGRHFMLNIVIGPLGYPAAVLIRGVAGINGPGRLTKKLTIGRAFDNQPASRKTGLWCEAGDVKIKRRQIKRAPRVGVDYAGPVWSRKPYRFYWSAEVK